MRAVILLVVALLVAACGTSQATEGDDPLTVGREVYGRVCSACHGPTGEGGVGPGLLDVLETFPTCEQHILWVELGSARWKDEVGPTYGALEKEVVGAMPSFAGALTEAEIRQVAAYERVRYGKAGVEAQVAECEG